MFRSLFATSATALGYRIATRFSFGIYHFLKYALDAVVKSDGLVMRKILVGVVERDLLDKYKPFS